MPKALPPTRRNALAVKKANNILVSRLIFRLLLIKSRSREIVDDTVLRAGYVPADGMESIPPQTCWSSSS